MSPIKPELNKMLIVTSLLIASGAANSGCQDAWVCVDDVRSGDNVELRARNLQDFPLTYTLQVKSASYSVEGSTTVTRTLRPQQTETAVRMQLRDGMHVGDYEWKLDWAVGVYDANHDDDHLYAFPYAPGRSFRIMQGFGSRFSHAGIEEYALDFEMPVGTPVHAARSGVVARVQAGSSLGCFYAGCGRYANFIVVLHSDGTTGEYYHLQQDGVFVATGDSVARGQLIGLSGNTGYTASPHLHFAVYRATNNGETQSVPIRFQSAVGVISRPRSGGIYQAAFQ